MLTNIPRNGEYKTTVKVGLMIYGNLSLVPSLVESLRTLLRKNHDYSDGVCSRLHVNI